AGTRVHLLLPIDTAIEPPPRPTPRSTRAARSVLVVDDRPDVRNALANALDVEGLVVYAAGSAAEAMTTLEGLAGEVDVVLSDVSMPQRSGIELADDVRDRWPLVPVVLMSGNAAQ